MADSRLADINERVALGILLREDSVYLLEKIAELEVKLAEARGLTQPSPSGSVTTQEQLP